MSTEQDRYIEYRYVFLVMPRNNMSYGHTSNLTERIPTKSASVVNRQLKSVQQSNVQHSTHNIADITTVVVSQQIQVSMALLNLEVSPIQDQVASVILDLQGNMVATTSTKQLTIDSTATKLLYQIFLEVGSLHLPSFRRITVSSSSLSMNNNNNTSVENADTDSNIRYILTRDDTHIYIVAQKQ